METKFVKGENIFFLKKGSFLEKGREEVLDRTDIQFYHVSDGVIINVNKDNGEYTIEREGCGIITVPNCHAFDSYKKAEAKAKELNNESIETLEKILKDIKGFYPL